MCVRVSNTDKYRDKNGENFVWIERSERQTVGIIKRYICSLQGVYIQMMRRDIQSIHHTRNGSVGASDVDEGGTNGRDLKPRTTRALKSDGMANIHIMNGTSRG
jgi:hypothetical protein